MRHNLPRRPAPHLLEERLRHLPAAALRCGLLLFAVAAGTTAAAAAAATATDDPLPGAVRLLSEAGSTRAIALESTVFTREPFSLTSPLPLSADARTRVMLFAQNLNLAPGEGFSAVTAEAEDAQHRRYALRVEYVGRLAESGDLSALILRLHDKLPAAGDVLVGVTYRGRASNRVRLGVGRIGGGLPDDEPTYVLEFDGSPQTVDYGVFWPEKVDLGKFFWEFWAMPGAQSSSRYLLTDGYGPHHALLFGFFLSDDPQRYAVYGNIYDGEKITTFSSDDGPAPGEWGHYAVGWDGRHIVTYFNGVPIGRTPFAGPRRSPGPAGGGGRLLIGGSDHNNLIGRIAQVRGYEGINPLDLRSHDRTPTAAFAPETIFGISNRAGGPASSFLSSFSRPGETVKDLAGGRVGRVRGVGYGILDSRQTALPRFVIDPRAPDSATYRGREGVPPPPAALPQLEATPAVVPAGARAFDSFSRRSSTYAFDGNGGLGAVEGGAAGRPAWRFGGPREQSSHPTSFGILNGRAVVLSNNTGIAWVLIDSTTGNLDVRVDRRPGRWGSGVQTGLCFRVVDGSNFFFAYTGDSDSDPFTTRTLTLGYWAKGVRTTLATGVRMPSEWTTLRVVTLSDGRIRVYADATLVLSIENGMWAAATGAGLYNDLGGLALTNRWDNFTVYDAAP